MDEKLLDEIKFRAEHESRTPQELFAAMRGIIMQMLLMKSMNREQVISFCACMISMYGKREG